MRSRRITWPALRDKPLRDRDAFSARDVLSEAAHGIGSRMGRLVLTTSGTVLGIASLVITIGLAQTAAGQISSQFDAVSSTQVTIKAATSDTMGGGEQVLDPLPWDAAERVGRLAGVEEAGTISAVDIGPSTVSSIDIIDPSAAAQLPPTVFAVSPGLIDAVRGELSTGRVFDAGHDERGDRVVILGEAAAERLGINRVDAQPSIFIDTTPYAVIGILESVERRGELINSLIVPMGTARNDFSVEMPEEVQIKIATGAGPLVAEQAPIALSPNEPENVDVGAPPRGSDLQSSVQADINVIFLVLSAIALLAGGLGIANITLLSVSERFGEIGLRRALGATPGNIGAQFIVESVLIGLLGGFIGASLGVFTVLGVSLVQEWTPILDPWMSFGSALLGGLVGLVAGGYPARKAALVEPIAALRGGV